MRKITPEPIADPVAEARRYVENAETVLREKGKYDPETGCYMDPKYVKVAGHYLWSAVLLILDAVFHVKNKKQPHPDIIDFRIAIGNRDKKLLTLVNVAYETLHITLGYDGNRQKDICMAGIRIANDIIDRCEKMLKKAA